MKKKTVKLLALNYIREKTKGFKLRQLNSALEQANKELSMAAFDGRTTAMVPFPSDLQLKNKLEKIFIKKGYKISHPLGYRAWEIKW